MQREVCRAGAKFKARDKRAPSLDIKYVVCGDPCGWMKRMVARRLVKGVVWKAKGRETGHLTHVKTNGLKAKMK